MPIFKRDKIFDKLVGQIIECCEEVGLPEEFEVTSGFVRVFKSEYDEISMDIKAFSKGFEIIKDNKRAKIYSQVFEKYQVDIVYNKNDFSLLVSVCREKNKR